MTGSADKPDAEANVKLFLTWGSVAYALGFATVMLHTYRLQMPVIELIQPIYVWIGLPLAIVAFFFKQITAFFMDRAMAVAAQVRSGWAQSTAAVTSSQLDVIAEVLGIFRSLPGLRSVLGPTVERLTQQLVGPQIDAILQQALKIDPARYAQEMAKIRRLLGYYRVFIAVGEALKLLGGTALFCILLVYYVWELYPQIPQSLGGGKPHAVHLIVEGTALPPSLAAAHTPAPAAAASDKPDKAMADLPAQLLYVTKDAYFVQTQSGQLLSIKADAVKSIVW